MTNPVSSLRRGNLFAAITVAAGILSASAVSAATCGHVNGSWTNAFNDSIYDCDGPSPAAECDVLVDLKSCCISASTQQERRDCVNAKCLTNETLLQSIGINTNTCD